MGWIFKADLTGPQGEQGEQGDRGDPGVNAVPAAEAVAEYSETPGNPVKVALDTSYAALGVPSNVTAFTKPGQVQANAAAVMRPFYAALSNRAAQKVNIVVVADSIVSGNGATVHQTRWVERFASLLRARFPIAGSTAAGGRGFIGAFNTLPGGGTFVWPSTLAFATAASNEYGPGRQATSLGATATITYTLVGTSADIMFVKYPGGGTFSWKVDGGAETNVATTGASVTDGNMVRIPLGAAGAHTLVLTGVTGTAFIDGVVEYSGDESVGFTVHDAGHSGYTAGDWNGAPFDPVVNWPAAINALAPSLIVIALGVNDVNTSVPVATFKTNLTGLMAKIRAPLTGPYPPVVLVPYGAITGKSAVWQNYVNAMYEITAADAGAGGNSIVADLSLRLPNYDDTYNYSMFYDGAHPNDKGHAMIAELLTQFLSPS